MRHTSTPTDLTRMLLDQIADKWTVLILSALCAEDGRARFNAIKRAVPGISQKSLSQCLRKLERSGLVQRRVLDTSPIGVEYSTTPLGYTLGEPFQALYDWARVHGNEVEEAQQRFDARLEAEVQD